MKIKKFIYLEICFALIICICVIFLWISFRRIGDQRPFFLTGHMVISRTGVLTSNQWNDIRQYYIQVVKNQNPRIALAELREQIKTNIPLLRSCHELTHEIGHAAFKKYGDFGKAMQYQDEVCNSGYLHGIIESYFSIHKNSLFSAMDGLCASYKFGSFISWECYHGIGHGMMFFTVNDLPKSLILCDHFSNVFARSACINGVFMENFNTDQKIHPSSFLKANDFFYPCYDQKFSDQPICYFYAPTYFLNLHPGQYAQSLLWCHDAPFMYQNSCINGVGSQVMKENISNPTYAEQICSHLSDFQRNICIGGMITIYINHYGGLTEAKTLCTKLQTKDQLVCRQVVSSESILF